MAIGRRRSHRRGEIRALITRLVTVLMLGGLSLASLYAYDYLTTTDKLVVKKIRVEGLSRVEESEVLPMLEDLLGRNIFSIPLAEAGRRVESHPRIKKANMKIVLPWTIVCRVVEREPVALLFDGGFLEVDEEGMVMGADELTDKLDLPVVTCASCARLRAGEKSTDPAVQAALKALRLCRELGGDFTDRISEIRIDEAGVRIVSLEDDCILVLDRKDLEGNLRKFFVLRETIERDSPDTRYIDLRFPDQIVLRNAL